MTRPRIEIRTWGLPLQEAIACVPKRISYPVVVYVQGAPVLSWWWRLKLWFARVTVRPNKDPEP